MSSQFLDHANKILAYLCGNGDTAILPPDTLGFSAADCTLRIHDGCTRGGRYMLKMLPRCEEKEVKVNPLTAVKGAVKILVHGDRAETITPIKIGMARLTFKADWPEFSDKIEVTIPFVEEEPEIVREDKNVKFLNYSKQIESGLKQYGIEARTVFETENKSQIAVRGPKELGPWSIEFHDSEDRVSFVSEK